MEPRRPRLKTHFKTSEKTPLLIEYLLLSEVYFCLITRRGSVGELIVIRLGTSKKCFDVDMHDPRAFEKTLWVKYLLLSRAAGHVGGSLDGKNMSFDVDAPRCCFAWYTCDNVNHGGRGVVLHRNFREENHLDFSA